MIQVCDLAYEGLRKENVFKVQRESIWTWCWGGGRECSKEWDGVKEICIHNMYHASWV